MGLGVNAKTINPTPAWPQAPIKFIYIFTLRPPLKRLCLDISKQRDAPIYLATELSQRTGSWDLVYPAPTVCSYPPPFNDHSKEPLLIAGLCRGLSIYIIRAAAFPARPLSCAYALRHLGTSNLLHYCLWYLSHMLLQESFTNVCLRWFKPSCKD